MEAGVGSGVEAGVGSRCYQEDVWLHRATLYPTNTYSILIGQLCMYSDHSYHCLVISCVTSGVLSLSCLSVYLCFSLSLYLMCVCVCVCVSPLVFLGGRFLPFSFFSFS